MVFKNDAQLKAFFMDKCKNAVASAEEKVHRIIDSCLHRFYDEWKPDQYKRTSQLLHSLVKSGVKPTVNGYEAEVYFDVNSLNYTTGSWDGETVLGVVMESSMPHGGYMTGTAIWNESKIMLGDIWDLLEKELKAQGIPIKRG